MSVTVTHKFVSSKIEQTDPTLIGPNEWNATHAVIDTSSVFWTTDYNININGAVVQFYTPPDNLSPSLRTVTFTNGVPLGINGSDSHHSLAIFNNAGVFQEVVLINGGTAISGGSSGNVTFSSIVGTYPAGSYKIGSATAGIRETIIVAGNGKVRIPSGNFTVYSNIYSEFGASIQGSGGYNSIISPAVQNVDTFHIIGASGSVGEISDLRIQYGPSGLTQPNCQHGTAIILENGYNNRVTNISITGYDYGIKIIATANPFLNDLMIMNVGVIGIWVNPSATAAGQSGILGTDITISGWGPSVGATTGIQFNGQVAGFVLSNMEILQICYCWVEVAGTYVVNESQATNIQLDGFGFGGLWLNGTRTGSSGGVSHKYVGWRITGQNSAFGVRIDSGYSEISMSDFTVRVPSNGVILNGCRNVALDMFKVSQYTAGNQTGNAIMLVADTDGSTCSLINISNSQIGYDVNGGTTSAWQFGILMDTAAHDNLTVSDCSIYGYGNSIAIEGSGSTNYVFNNCNFTGPSNFNSVGGTAKFRLINCIGGDLAVATVNTITASTITLPVTHENVIICSADGSGGVATIAALNGTLWNGRRVRIIATHANGIAFNTSGNIRVAKTLTTGQSVDAVYDGAKWSI